MVDLDPQKLKPSWTNRRSGEDNIAKRLDRLLLVEKLLEKDLMFRKWVDLGVDSDHMRICLEFLKKPKKPTLSSYVLPG